MKLTGTDGQQFELAILGYEFPESRRKGTENNWLIVQVTVNHPEEGNWAVRDPSLLTHEVQMLIEWLTTINRGESVREELEFSEPNLEFRLVSTGPGSVLRIYLECELRPPWRATQCQEVLHDLWVQFPIAEVNIVEAISSLRRQLSRYPTR